MKLEAPAQDPTAAARDAELISSLRSKAESSPIGRFGLPTERESQFKLKRGEDVKEYVPDPRFAGEGQKEASWIAEGSPAWRGMHGGQPSAMQRSGGMQGSGGFRGISPSAMSRSDPRSGASVKTKYDDPKLQAKEDAAARKEKNKYNIFAGGMESKWDPRREKSPYEYGTPFDIKMSSIGNPFSGTDLGGLRGLGRKSVFGGMGENKVSRQKDTWEKQEQEGYFGLPSPPKGASSTWGNVTPENLGNIEVPVRDYGIAPPGSSLAEKIAQASLPLGRRNF